MLSTVRRRVGSRHPKSYFFWPQWADSLSFKDIKAGEGIIAACQSGNRDEEVFPNPNQFDMHRKFNPENSLGFGYGAHRCIAECLAKAELEIVFGWSFPCLVPAVKECFQGTRANQVLVCSDAVPEAAKFETGHSDRGAQIHTANDGHRGYGASSGVLTVVVNVAKTTQRFANILEAKLYSSPFSITTYYGIISDVLRHSS
jgi:Cytochrome P450